MSNSTWNLIGQLNKFVLQILSVAILARILGAGDFGLFALLTSIYVGFTIFQDAGFSLLTITKPFLSDDDYDRHYTYTLIISFFLTLAMFFTSGLFAEFFDEYQLDYYLKLMAFLIMLSALSLQPIAFLRRELKIKEINILESCSIAVAAIVSICYALLVPSVEALIVQRAVYFLTLFVLAFSTLKKKFVLKFNVIERRENAKYSITMSVYSLVNYLERNSDNLLIAKKFTSENLGVYNRFYSLITIPITFITGIFGPQALSELSRCDKNSLVYSSIYIKYLRNVSVLSSVFMTPFVIYGDELRRLFLGSNFSGYDELISIFSLIGLFQIVDSTTGWLFLSQGRNNDLLKWTLICWLLFFVAMAVGSFYGIYGVAIGILIANALTFVPQFFFAIRGTSLTITLVLSSIAKGYTFFICLLFTYFLYDKFLGQIFNLFWIVEMFIVYLITFVIAFRVRFMRTLIINLYFEFKMR